MATRTVSIGRLVAALVVAGLVLSAAFASFGSWQLRRWLRSQTAALGCSLEYASVTAVVPNGFKLRSAQLSDCNGGRWGVRVVRGSGEVLLHSMIWGPIQPAHVELELDSLRVGAVTLDGTVHVEMERRAGEVQTKVFARELTLRQGGHQLASGSRLDLEVLSGASGTRGRAHFALQSFATTRFALATEGSVEGSFHLSWDDQVPRLQLQGHLDAVPLLLSVGSLEATLQSLHISASPDRVSARAALTLDGPNAHVLLEALRASRSLRFALSVLENAAFTFSASVSYGAGAWTFDDIRLDTDNASVTGFASMHGSNRAGRLRLTYGEVAMGVRFSNDESSVIFNPAEDWLRSTR